SFFYNSILSIEKKKPNTWGGGAPPRHSSFGFYVLRKTYIAIKNKPSKGFKRTKWHSHFVL
ncbi:MAG: hypothetical protein ACK6CP_12800, partial [Pseudanabaena sp.]